MTVSLSHVTPQKGASLYERYLRELQFAAFKAGVVLQLNAHMQIPQRAFLQHFRVPKGIDLESLPQTHRAVLRASEPGASQFDVADCGLCAHALKVVWAAQTFHAGQVTMGTTNVAIMVLTNIECSLRCSVERMYVVLAVRMHRQSNVSPLTSPGPA